jgi:hypothetical protein
MACAGCASNRGPQLEKICVVTPPDKAEIRCKAPERSYDGERCNCADPTGAVVLLGRVRSEEVTR